MNKRLHILFLCGWFPSRVSPTNGDFIQRHAQAVSLKHKVTIIHIISDKNTNGTIEIDSNTINGIETHIAYLKHTKNPIRKGFLFLKAYKILLAKIDFFDMIHLNETFPFGILSLYSKWVQKKPFIISEHWTGYHFPNSKNISFLQKKITKIITKNASFVCPVTNDLTKSMTTLGFKGEYKRVPNVVDTNLFYPIENNNSTFTVTHISNMINEHKNIEGLLRVIAKTEKQIEEINFKIIGENSDKYLNFAKKLNINLKKTTFINQIPHNEIAKELQNSNLFVLFSNYENLPCVILEAFSCGVPVISTNVGGIKEFFPENFGYLIDTKDETALLNKIKLIFNNFKVDKNKMHHFVEKEFSETSIANQFTTLYQKTLNT